MRVSRDSIATEPISVVPRRDRAGGSGLEAEEDLGEGRLAAAGLADDGEGLGLAGVEGDELVGLHHAGVAAEEGVGADLVVFAQAVDGEHDLADGGARAAVSRAAGGVAQSISVPADAAGGVGAG